MKKPEHYLDPATASHLTESKWLTSCLTILGLVALPLFVLRWLLGAYGAWVVVGAAGLYLAGPALHELREVFVQTADVVVEAPLWI